MSKQDGRWIAEMLFAPPDPPEERSAVSPAPADEPVTRRAPTIETVGYLTYNPIPQIGTVMISRDGRRGIVRGVTFDYSSGKLSIQIDMKVISVPEDAHERGADAPTEPSR